MLTCTRPNNTREICTYNDAGYIVEIKNVKNLSSNDNDVESIDIEEINTENINIESSDIVISDYTYTYDAVGNIVSIDGYENTNTESEISNLKSESFKYDTENRLISYNGEEVLYDADGNMIYGPVNGVMSELKYDCRNRLVSAGEISYTYDAENNRISTISGDTVEEYVVDTVSNSLSRVLVQTTHTKTGQSEKQNTEQVKERTYIYGAGLIYETEDDEIYYHHYNNLGSTMYLTDDDGEILASYTYGTYGELLNGDNTLTHYLYNGRAGVSTDDNGLYYMRQRYYNTDIKRFINSDILTGSIDNSQSLNRYSYVQGNPVSYTDPFGLSPMSGFFSGTGLAHGIFGILGCVPGPIGIAANVADALVYGIVDHDATGVTLSLLGALTMGAGSVAKLAGAGAKVTKTAKAIQYGSMFTTSGLQFALNARNTINVGKTMYDKYIVNGQKTDKNTYAEVAALALNSAGMFISGTQIYSSGRGFVNELSTSVNSNVLTEVNAGGREAATRQSGIDKGGSGYYEDANGRWHRPNGQFASNAEMGIDTPVKTSTGTHGNSLSDPRTNYGYALVDKDTNEILKFGETLYPDSRYSQNFLDKNNAKMIIMEQGSKADIHYWQHDMNEYYFNKYDEYPPLNSKGW